MKKFKRFITTALIAGLMMTLLTGCDEYREQIKELFGNWGWFMADGDEPTAKPTAVPVPESTPEPTATPTPTPEPTKEPDSPETDPTATVLPMSELEYVLTEEDIAEFEAQLLLCETMLEDGVSFDDMEEAADALDEIAYNIQNQATIAEILYYYDKSDEEAVEDYLFSSEVSTEITSEYIGFLVNLYNSGAYEEYFNDLLDIELRYLECYSDETTELEIRNSEILTEFYDSQVGGNFEDEMGALYTEFVKNSNEIAVKHGFANNYDYASTFSYKREYSKEEREKYRELVKEYIIPLYNMSYVWYEEAYYGLSRRERKIVDALIADKYNELDVDYVNGYFEALPEDSKNGMQHMFKNETYYMTDNLNALQGAFTVDIRTPYCYFGPGYQDAFTVIHEIGHYYADLNNDTSWLCFDLCEVHSQGNEMLFLNYLGTVLDPKVFEALEAYKLYAFINTIVQATLMDNFEEIVYNLSFEESYTTADFDEIMHEVIRSYGIDDSDEYTYASLDWLWRNVSIGSPVYYISYGTSAMAALSLYGQSVVDFDSALESYRILQEECEQEDGFKGMLEKSGIASVFEEEAYIQLQEIMNQ